MTLSRRVILALWLVLPVLIILGLMRLRFDVEVLNLLPSDDRTVQGLKLYQQRFANASELVVTIASSSAEQTQDAARAVAEELRRHSNLVATVTWQPPWLENPGQIAELIAHLWLNQPPEVFSELTNRLAPGRIAETLAATRDQLATSMSPNDIARLSYDPLGLTQLPENVSAPSFAQGQDMFASEDGTFRIVFVQSAAELATYRDCAQWLAAIRRIIAAVPAGSGAPGEVAIHYTGRPAFVAEISGGMEEDITVSVGGTSVIIAILFWLAHRRVKPMLWLLTLLALILAGTLALGGLIFGAINVVSMGFAAILLGLAVDYAVVHYQEALAHPNLSIPQIRRAIAPSIFWAAVTTITAFLVLNFGGLPGLAQLGSLVGVGVALAALVMIFAFLPPLFPERRSLPRQEPSAPAGAHGAKGGGPLIPPAIVLGISVGLLAFCINTLLFFGAPKIDQTPNALRPRQSEAYTTLETIKQHLGREREPLWLLVSGRAESEVAQRLDQVQATLDRAARQGVVTNVTLPTALWPRPDNQQANRPLAQWLASQQPAVRAAVLSNDFTETSLGLTEGILKTWERAARQPGVFWPENDLSRWILQKVVARGATDFVALGFLNPPADAGANSPELAQVAAELPRDGVWLSGWELLGASILARVKSNLWKLVLPMIALVLVSLWLAFRRPAEILLSLGILVLSGLLLLAVMRLAGWSWNLLNLMAIPLILGTGVDYSLFMQLALRRHQGDAAITHRSVGRALLLCGGTAIAGFGALIFSSNAGMASLGQVCAVGIAGNMLISIYLLPVWWKFSAGRSLPPVPPPAPSNPAPNTSPNGNGTPELSAPSSLYRSEFWRMGLGLVRFVPRPVCLAIGRVLADIYWALAWKRRQAVIENLLPALNNDEAAARRTARQLVHQFAVKVIDLWRYEVGLPIQNTFGAASGWEHFEAARAEKRGILLLTPHLGNWEFGGPWLTQKGVTLIVVTLAEPGRRFTELRQASRARWNIETLVIGSDPFAFVEIIRRLEAGATVALLVDRPPASSAVTVELFGRPFPASIAAAELARASGCLLLPVYLPREGDTYAAHILPPIPCDRASLRDPAARQKLTQQVIRAFEPIILKHLDQWYHFIPIWPK